jgi:uncharacterized membrane protein YeiH
MRRGNLYATAAMAGVAAYLTAARLGAPVAAAALLGMAVIVTLRMASIFWGLRLPVFSLPDTER